MIIDHEKAKFNQDQDLEFKPLTEGLGFQPFSDGLPYAPLSKRGVPGATLGSGATVAGPHRFQIPRSQKDLKERKEFDSLRQNQNQMSPLAKFSSTPSAERSQPSTAPQARVSVSSLSSPQVEVPIATLSSTSPLSGAVSPQIPSSHFNSTSFPAPASASISSHARKESSDEQMEREVLPSHYLLKRVVAYGLDFIFNAFLMSVILLITFWFYEVESQTLFHSSLIGVGVFLLLVMNWILVLLQEVVFKTSLGKLFFRLVLNGSRPQILARGFVFVLSSAFGGMGLIWAWFNPNKACFHDQVLGSQPLEMNNYE